MQSCGAKHNCLLFQYVRYYFRFGSGAETRCDEMTVSMVKMEISRRKTIASLLMSSFLMSECDTIVKFKGAYIEAE